eukprot:61111_1
MWNRFRKLNSSNGWNKFTKNVSNISRFKNIYPITCSATLAITITNNQGERTGEMRMGLWTAGIIGIVGMFGAAYGAKTAYNYHNNAMAYATDDVVFEQYEWGKNVTVLNDGKTVKMDGHQVAKLSGSYNSGIHAFRIRWTKTTNASFSHRVVLMDEQGGRYCYLWGHHIGSLPGSEIYQDQYAGKQSDRKAIVNSTKNWESGTSICVIMDCLNWKLTFIFDEGTSYQIDIARNKTYGLFFERDPNDGESVFDIIPIE